MTKDTVVAFRAPEGFSPDPLTDLLRQGARELIAQAVEAELNGFLAAPADQTDTAGRGRLVRHGHLPERDIQTGIGAAPVKVPRVRDREPEGGRLRFTSTILPPYLRRAKSIEELLPWLYLDNIFIERLWRSLKYECVYLHAWETGSQAKAGVGRWITFYNHQRPHAAHGGQPPAVVYFNPTQTGQLVQAVA